MPVTESMSRRQSDDIRNLVRMLHVLTTDVLADVDGEGELDPILTAVVLVADWSEAEWRTLAEVADVPWPRQELRDVLVSCLIAMGEVDEP